MAKVDLTGYNLKNDSEYFGYPALSQSSINQFKISPAKFWDGCVFNENANPFKGNDATVFGNLCHCLLLEPEKLAEEFYILTDAMVQEHLITKQGNVAKTDSKQYSNWFASIQDELDGKKLIHHDLIDKALAMVNHLKEYPVAQKLFDGMEFEVGHVWQDDATGILCKGKADGIKINADGDVIVFDYKTTGKDVSSINPEKEGWLIQTAMYGKMCMELYGKFPSKFTYIVQSTTMKNMIRPINIPIADVMVATIELEYYMQEIKRRLIMWQVDGVNPNMAFSHAISIHDFENVSASEWWARRWTSFAQHQEDGGTMLEFVNSDKFVR